MTQNILCVFALEQESQNEFEGYPVLYTGVGKINAAYALTREIMRSKPDIVVNLGTAGSAKHATGSLVNCISFVQRDMDVTPLGFEKYQTPFSDTPIVVEHGEAIEGMMQGTCVSGDSFDISGAFNDFDAIDMEGYALAEICRREGVPFLCLKYISDGADGNAAQDWNETLKHAAEALRAVLGQSLTALNRV
jgi:adenosylhomocysteine nucleosidase